MNTHESTNFPLPADAGEQRRPGRAESQVVIRAPETGAQRWAGAPTALLDTDGSTLLAYRIRDGEGDRVAVARSDDGVRFSTVTQVTARALGVPMVERAALVRTPSAWRMYMSCAEPGTKNWWIGLLESRRLTGLPDADLRRLQLGGPQDAVKDPIVRKSSDGWHAWICRHPLDVPGAEDRMATLYAASDDGVSWHTHGVVLAGRPGQWDARGARVTSVLADGRACYDGRATAEENWFERTGIAVSTGGGARLRALPGGPVRDVRYLEVLALPTGGHRLYFEARRPDGAHELRTELRVH